MKYMNYIFLIIFLNSCGVITNPHRAFVDLLNSAVLHKQYIDSPSIKRLDMPYFSHITEDINDNLRYHFVKRWRKGNGRCKDACRYYYIVNARSKLIIGYGFDECDKENCCWQTG